MYAQKEVFDYMKLFPGRQFTKRELEIEFGRKRNSMTAILSRMVRSKIIESNVDSSPVHRIYWVEKKKVEVFM